MEDCGQEPLHGARKVARVECMTGRACRQPYSCGDSPKMSSGQLLHIPSKDNDFAEYRFLYFCLCGDDCWDDTRKWTPYGTPSEMCPTVTETLSPTETLPTATVTHSVTLTETATLTLPTVTPSDIDMTDQFKSRLFCTPHYTAEQTYFTGAYTVCTFTAISADGEVVTTNDDAVVTVTVLNTPLRAPLRAVQEAGVKGIYTARLPPFSAEGIYHVRATYSSRLWAHFEVSVDNSLPVEQGFPQSINVRCPQHRSNETDPLYPFASDGSGKLAVGATVVCRVQPLAPDCPDCRLKLPIKVAASTTGWNVSVFPTITDFGVDSVTDPFPVVYAIAIRNLQLNAATDAGIQFSILTPAQTNAAVASGQVRELEIPLSGKQYGGSVEFTFYSVVVSEGDTGAVSDTASADYQGAGEQVYMRFSYGFDTPSSYQMACPPTPEAPPGTHAASLDEPLAALDIAPTTLYSGSSERQDQPTRDSTWVPPDTSVVGDVRYCIIRSMSSVGKPVVPSLVSPDVFTMHVEGVVQNLTVPTILRNGANVTLTVPIDEPSPFFITNVKNVFAEWGQDSPTYADVMQGGMILDPGQALVQRSAADMPVSRIGIAASRWGVGRPAFYYGPPAVVPGTSESLPDFTSRRENASVEYLGPSPPLYSEAGVAGATHDKDILLAAYSGATRHSWLTCGWASGVHDAHLDAFYMSRGPSSPLPLFPGVVVGCTVQARDVVGDFVPEAIQNLVVGALGGASDYVDVSPLQKGPSSSPEGDSAFAASPGVGFSFSFTLEGVQKAADVFSRFATKRTSLVVQMSHTKMQHIVQGSKSHLDYWKAQGSPTGYVFDDRVNPYEPYYPLISEPSIVAISNENAVENVALQVTVGAVVTPMLELYYQSRAATGTVENSEEVFILFAVMTGPGTDSHAFDMAGKNFSWVCTQSQSSDVVVSVAQDFIHVNSTEILSQGISQLRCQASVTWWPPSGVPEYIPATGWVEEAITVSFNRFDNPGSILVSNDSAQAHEQDAVRVESPASGTLRVSCVDFTDTDSPLAYLLRTFDPVSRVYEDLTVQQLSTEFTYPMPHVGPVEYNFSLWCAAVDAKGAKTLSSNSVDVTVGPFLVPAGSDAQNMLVSSLYSQFQAAAPPLGFFVKAMEQLRMLTAASASSLVIGVTSVLSGLHKALPSTNTSSTPLHTAVIADTVYSAAQTLKLDITREASDSDREEAFFGMSTVLRSIGVGSDIYRSAVLRMAAAVDGMREVLGKQAVRTPSPVSQGSREASALALSQGQDEEMAGSVIDTVCNSGVSLGLNLDPGTCTSEVIDASDLSFTSCAYHMGDLLRQPVVGHHASAQFTRVVHDGVKVATDTPVIVVLGSLQNSYFGFDASSRALLGRVASLCVYNRDTESYLEAASSVVQWNFTLHTQYREWPIPASATGAVYVSSRFSTVCNATSVDVASVSLQVECAGIGLRPMIAAPIAKHARCLPAVIEGCEVTNNAEDIAFCRCVRCGNGFIDTPFAGGLLCRKDVKYRCDSVAHVTDALLCDGGATVINNQCRCLPGLTCRGDPGVCTTNKRCGEIGSGYECVESGLMHDTATQTCTCRPESPSHDVFCDAGTCRTRVGCGLPAEGKACGHGSALNTTSERCECPEHAYCDTAALPVPTCRGSGRCSEHPPSGDSSLCLAGLGFQAGTLGVRDSEATRVSAVVSMESTSVVLPVSGADKFAVALSRNFKRNTAAGVLHNVDDVTKGGWAIVEATPTFRVEPPTSSVGVSTFITLLLDHELTQLSNASKSLQRSLLNALQVPALGTSADCVVEADATSGVSCTYSMTRLELSEAPRYLQGACVCQDDLICVSKNCTCPKCLNGGVCRWPELGVLNHNCTCPVGWGGADCSVKEEQKHYGIVYIFPDARYSEYAALPAANQSQFVKSARAIINEASGGVEPQFKMYIYEGSIALAVSVNLLESIWRQKFMKAGSYATAESLKNRLSPFLFTPFGIPKYEIRQAPLCPTVPNCVDVPAHWTTPACQCMEVCHCLPVLPVAACPVLPACPSAVRHRVHEKPE
eukprot:TRINITY_DN2019_c1_g2_i1.p1 TRINITY_DN2019_c1_g2~~TRINITY_DN2019_c1_g2_i1.p1  ORF type:complete len:2258 (+),score=532.80 TRINITY_DN2019_c1_g2_i1:652-6774(+)